ncbi:MAG: tRNA (N(6)-L-threonylcarbamoyladenosine(37)-C(2))-methylthiotransferase MtaB [Alphaproteobacteria bacterium]|nr:tRNA (N(6)-L-threonylcarbamoyladenosine(37)-C(2))-methylthiotransferase MtaB [Alphaproteobacteria bacterium]
MEKVITFGCRLNIFESEVIKTSLDKVDSGDVIVFNTCSVTQEAEKQAIKSIKKANRNHPTKRIIVTGCAAQVNPKKYSELEEVDLVLGNTEKFNSENYSKDTKEKILVSDIMDIKESASHLVTSFGGKTRAFIEIQNGCNHRCTFCTIPFGRGNNRSIAIGDIVNQVSLLADQGYKEIVLTGVDITDYGSNLPGKPTLGEMIKRLLSLVPNLPRLRLSSIDVAEVDNTLLQLILHEKRLMPHFHISLQSGDNMILKRMKRRHNRDQVIDFCNIVRKYRKDAAFGADIIAGFPTETEEMFANSLNLIKEANIQYIHAFPYSERDGTPAARMPQVKPHLRKERTKELIRQGKIELNKFSKEFVGQTVNVLVEKNNIGVMENFLKIHISENVPQNTIKNVYISDFNENKLIGNIVK